MDALPDYSKFNSLEELYEAYGQVDMDKHPEQLEAIIEEVERRKKAGKLTEEFDNTVILTRFRLFSFFIDLFIHRIFIIVCLLFALAVFEPFTYEVFKKNEYILFIVSLLLYFLFFEGRGKRKASLGKTFFKLNVINHEGEPASFYQIVIRTVSFITIFLLNWGEMVYHFGLGSSWVYLADTIQVILILYNLWLVKYSSDGFMMHDRFSATQVSPLDLERPVLLSQKSSTIVEFIKLAVVLLWVLLNSFTVQRLFSMLFSFSFLHKM